jgi:GH18 family chitinase
VYFLLFDVQGGSWAGDNNDCWKDCFGKEASVVSQLGLIVETQGFDGVDIDYEYFHSTTEQQHFLREVTIRLRNILPEGSIVSHAPMDSDLVPGQG